MAVNPKRKAVLERIQRLEAELVMCHEYLTSGKHAHWPGFHPIFDHKVRDGKQLPPHKSWVKNYFLPCRERALRLAEKVLERLS